MTHLYLMVTPLSLQYVNISEAGDEEGLDPADENMFDPATIKVFQVE